MDTTMLIHDMFPEMAYYTKVINDPMDTVADNQPPPAVNLWPCKQEEENSMFDTCEAQCAPRAMKAKYVSAPVANAQVIAPVTVEQTQRDYAIERIRKIGNDKLEALSTQFHLNQRNPRTWNELKVYLDSGDFTVDADKADSEEAAYYNVFYGVTFGPKPDKKGYEVAKKQLRDDTQKALDKATLGDVAGLEALIDDIAAWEYTAK